MLNRRFLTRTGLALLISANLTTVSATEPPVPANASEVTARFKAADKNGDGKLTLEEAKAGMPRIAAIFDKIDTDKKGYLTLPEILKVAETQQR
jgi:Ca2+-binding EF-hand superfamily protein